MGKDDSSNNLAALGLAMGAMGMNSGRMEKSETHKEADKACVSALNSMAETMDKLNNLIKDAEKPNEFTLDSIADLAERMSSMAASMSTLRMSIGLGFTSSYPGMGMS
ncbi:MAG: hypothetical protein IJ313_10535 [Clostridia bacterium]|nr:hypothetical protein [Clostridia bacterium]